MTQDTTIDIDVLPSLQDSYYERCCTMWRWYKTYVIGWFLILLLLGGILLGILASKTPPHYPCLEYSSTTLASLVSTDCLQYVWNQNCPIPYSFVGYTGWWRSSPQGTALIKCNQTPCGVGSYGNICIYMGLCLIGYGH